jgi:tRNA dimethylallyltransferase
MPHAPLCSPTSPALPAPAPAPLLAIVGPTASGKSALAVWLAQRFGGEVVACDSTQVYRGFDIGTAKPAPEERHGIPHHMMDLVAPEEVFTAGEYRRCALEVLATLRQSNRLPMFTVGTGLYLRALLEGLADAPVRSEALRARFHDIAVRRGTLHLHSLLRRLDPASALRISRNDRQKLVRALEVCLLAGRPLTEVHRSGREGLRGYTPLKLGLLPPRAALYSRIEERAQRMLERGWLAEVASLIERGTPASAKPFQFIGYRELRAHMEGGAPLAEAVTAITQATRRYAKRQLTWFRKEPNVRWLHGFGDRSEIMEEAAACVGRDLAAHSGHAVPLPVQPGKNETPDRGRG